jgi:hypothetical protein
MRGGVTVFDRYHIGDTKAGDRGCSLATQRESPVAPGTDRTAGETPRVAHSAGEIRGAAGGAAAEGGAAARAGRRKNQ